MTQVRENAPSVPAHIPPELVVDFDFFQPPGLEDDVHLAWKRLHNGPDIFWTPRNGGHWVATRAEDIEAMQIDHERFSHAEFMLPKQPKPYPMLPLDQDPPQHAKYRSLISPAFAPTALAGLEQKARNITISLIEELAPKGECEFVGDFAKVLPIVVFLGIVDLPETDRDILLPWAEDIVRGSSVDVRIKAHQNVHQYLAGWIAERTARPGNDLISKIAQASIDGRPITTPEVFGLCSLVLVGGLDTVASMLSFVARFLALNPGHRQQLVEQPALIPQAIEELFRRHGLGNTARYIAQDFDYKGIPFRKGDMIQLPNSLYGLDERKVDDPLTVDFHRKQPVPHATFGNGPHRCPGANLARREVKVFLEEWLKRIPGFSMKPGEKAVMTSGLVNGIVSLPLAWNKA